MQKNPKVSVIMPVYNTATFLREAMESVTNQTLCDIEIIAVNDGSTDGSGNLLKDFASQDDRITVLEQTNQGQSCARNAALPLAKGDYIYFMDSDDVLHPETLDLCWHAAEDNHLDFVFFDAEVMVSGTYASKQDYCRKGQLDDTRVWDGQELLDYEIDHFLYRTPVWLYFVRRSYLKSVFPGFYPGIIHEDHLFAIPLHLNAGRVMYLPRPFFQRRVRNESTMHSRFTMRNIKGYTVTTEELETLAGAHPEWAALIRKFLGQMLDAVVWESHRLTFADKCRVFISFIRHGWFARVRFRQWLVFWLKGGR